MANFERPNPDELLKAIQEQEANKRGRLKVFFGACAGVGKTYAMLSSAHEKLDDHIDVLAGIVATHGRPETEELLRNIPQLAPIMVEHHGIHLKEFDLDGALRAKPALILIDELAHSNPEGSRHPKRWMDVAELLEAGIDVFTTLNVQHIESLNDKVAEVTGIRVRETVPDSFFDQADDITLVDIPSDELLERLKEGKVYLSDQDIVRAAENFFRRENLIVLREFALRRTAERVDAQSDFYQSIKSKQHSLVRDRLAVCIGPGDLSQRLLRAAKRLALGLHTTWVALYVENSRHYRLDQTAQMKLERNLRLAEQLGAATVILHGEDAAAAIVAYAQQHGISKIIAGKPSKSRWQEFIKGALVNDLIHLSGKIDIYVISGDDLPVLQPTRELQIVNHSWKKFISVSFAMLIASLGGLLLRDWFGAISAIMFYLAGIALIAGRHGWNAALICVVAATLLCDFIFTQPYYSFLVTNSIDSVSLGLFFIIGLIIAWYTAKLQSQSYFFRRKERNTSALYSLSHELAGTREQAKLIPVIRKHLELTLDGRVLLWLPNANGQLELVSHPGLKVEIKEAAAAHWCFEHDQLAGLGTNTMPSAHGYYLPLAGSRGVLGVLGVIPHRVERQFNFEERELLETFASLSAAALERAAAHRPRKKL